MEETPAKLDSLLKKQYRKHFIPLESNPDLFTELIHELGVSSSLCFQDVLSLDEELLAFVPRPALALVLVFPAADEQAIAADNSTQKHYEGSGDNEDVVWFKQTIHNACGLYGILHAVFNGEARRNIVPNSTFSDLLAKSIPLKPERRAMVLEDSTELESAYRDVAKKGDTKAPENPEDEVDFHYVCFVKSHKNCHLYELDGDKSGPIDRGTVEDDGDMLSQGALRVIHEFIDKENGGNINFSLMALVPAT